MNLAAVAPHTALLPSTVRPASAVDPGQPTLPGLESDVLARAQFDSYDGPAVAVHARAGATRDPRTFAAFDEALDAAHALATDARHDARFGFLHLRQGPIDGIAVVEATKGFRLVQTDVSPERYSEEVPGAMWFGQYWTRSGALRVLAESPSTAALVGATQWFDLRGGTPAQATPFPKD